MDAAADLATMLSDWDSATILGVTYRGVFNNEVYGLENGVDRVPTFTMRTEDADAIGLDYEGDVVINGVTWQARGFSKQGDGAETVVTLAR